MQVKGVPAVLCSLESDPEKESGLAVRWERQEVASVQPPDTRHHGTIRCQWERRQQEALGKEVVPLSPPVPRRWRGRRPRALVQPRASAWPPGGTCPSQRQKECHPATGDGASVLPSRLGNTETREGYPAPL